MFSNGSPNVFINEEIEVQVKLQDMLRHFFYQYKDDEEYGSITSRYAGWQASSTPPEQFMLNAVKDGKLTPNVYEPIMYTGSQSPYGSVRIRFDFETETTSLGIIRYRY